MMDLLHDLCYAKKVDGGYTIVGSHMDEYFVTDLPKKCLTSGRTVIENAEIVDRLFKIEERADALSKNLFDLFCLNTRTAVNAIPDKTQTRDELDEKIARMLACSGIPDCLVDVANQIAESMEGWAHLVVKEVI